MQIVININDAAYGTCVDVNKYVKRNDIIFLEYLIDVIANGTPIPDNATNGDVIEKVFNTTSTQFCELVRMDNIDNGLCCSLEWWNAPYQKGGKE